MWIIYRQYVPIEMGIGKKWRISAADFMKTKQINVDAIISFLLM